MKIVVVQFPDTADISSLVAGATAAVNAVGGGVVLAASPVWEPPVTLPPHSHPVVGLAGEPEPG